MNTSPQQDRIPYTYLIGWKDHDKWYYGSRTANGCHPAELWVKYFTSSTYVAEARKVYGEPDIVVVRKIFSCKKKCMIYEAGIIRRLISKAPQKWLNKTYWKGTSYYITDDIRQKMSMSKLGNIPWNKGLTKHNDERLESLSEKNKGPNGRKLTTHHKEAIGRAWRGKKRDTRSQDHKRKIIESKRQNGTLNVKWSPKKTKKIKGRIGITNIITGKKTKIDKEDLDIYLRDGWVEGWINHNNQHTINKPTNNSQPERSL